MPLYMDRHDISDHINAEIIAKIHLEDVKIQDQFGCRVLTYWYDEKRNNTFCLIEAPNADAIHKMHDVAHGQVPNTVIEVSAELVEAFLGRVEDPEKPADAELNIISESALRTIMIISLKPNQYSNKNNALHKFHEEALEMIEVQHGSVVKQNENCFMASFASPSKAVQAAFNIRSLFNMQANQSGKDGFALTIGLSAGVPVSGNNSFFESTIKLAERMCKIMKGEIIVSSSVKELYDSENVVMLKEDEQVLCMTEMEEKFLTALMDYAERNWQNKELKIDDLSRALGYSKSQLYRKLTSLTGQSPNNFLQEYRLIEAHSLITKKVGNISEVAYQTGFSSPSYFSKCFKKRFGYLPLEARVMNTR